MIPYRLCDSLSLLSKSFMRSNLKTDWERGRTVLSFHILGLPHPDIVIADPTRTVLDSYHRLIRRHAEPTRAGGRPTRLGRTRGKGKIKKYILSRLRFIARRLRRCLFNATPRRFSNVGCRDDTANYIFTFN